MAKIGTAHVEIKPVLADGALDDITKRIADAVAEGVRRGMANGYAVPVTTTGAFSTFSDSCLCNPLKGGSGVCNCTLGGPQIRC